MQNSVQAQYALGRMYAAGEGVRQDYAEALRWFRKAAAQGCALAQNRLGVMYERGIGVAQDYVEAYKWYSVAAGENQNIFAVANRDALAQRLGPEKVAQAQRDGGKVLAQNSNQLAPK